MLLANCYYEASLRLVRRAGSRLPMLNRHSDFTPELVLVVILLNNAQQFLLIHAYLIRNMKQIFFMKIFFIKNFSDFYQLRSAHAFRNFLPKIAAF
jgi:hypothetical protein